MNGKTEGRLSLAEIALSLLQGGTIRIGRYRASDDMKHEGWLHRGDDPKRFVTEEQVNEFKEEGVYFRCHLISMAEGWYLFVPLGAFGEERDNRLRLQEIVDRESVHIRKAVTLEPSGRYIIDQDHRKIAEMYQPGDSPAETEAIKRRIVRSFNALPDLVGVLMRADKEGALWQALFNEGITDAYDAALKDAVEALGETGIADVALLYELDPNSIRAKLGE